MAVDIEDTMVNEKAKLTLLMKLMFQGDITSVS